MGAGRQPLSPELAAALAEVTQVCADAPRPAVLANRDPVTAEEDARLLAVPLGSLNAQDCWHYASEGGNALNPAEVAYFLPRLCELVAEGHCPSPIGWGSAFFALKLSAFPDAWCPTRVEAVQRFAEEFALDWLSDPDGFNGRIGAWGYPFESLGELLGMLAAGGIDISPVLSRLYGAPRLQLSRALVHWIEEGAQKVVPYATADDLLEDLTDLVPEPQHETVASWLKAIDVPAMLTRVLEGEEDEAWRDRLERALVLWP